MHSLIRLLAPAALASAAVGAGAALPPQHQRTAELRAVLDDDKVAEAFDGTPIDRIEYVAPDRYRVSAGRCRLDVAIVGLPTPPDVAGPRRFAVRAGRKTCGR